MCEQVDQKTYVKITSCADCPYSVNGGDEPDHCHVLAGKEPAFCPIGAVRADCPMEIGRKQSITYEW
jgi:hypothetical protein